MTSTLYQLNDYFQIMLSKLQYIRTYNAKHVASKVASAALLIYLFELRAGLI